MRRPFAKTCDPSQFERSERPVRGYIRRSCAATSLLACGLVLALGGAHAQAAPKGLHAFMGSSGTGGGQFNTPRGVAVKHSTGDVYVVDSLNNRIQQFGPAGNFVRAWGWDVDGTMGSGTGFEVCDPLDPCQEGDSGSGPGQLSSAQGIAVDQRTGDVYVTNQGNRRVEKFSSSGEFELAFGWNVVPDVEPNPPGTGLETCTSTTGCQIGASGSGLGQFGTTMGYPAVDPANGELIDGTLNGNVVVADPANRRVQKFTSSGGFVAAFGGATQFVASQPTRVAVDSSGSIYTVEGGTGRRVKKFNPSGTSAVIFAPDHVSGTNGFSPPLDVAVDPGNDNVVVTKAVGQSSTTVTRRVVELNPVGDLVDNHAVGAGLPAPNGLALAASSGTLYLPTSTDHRIWVFGPITPPLVTMNPVEAITAVSATFRGTVNPNGTVATTSYRFEYSDDGGATWQRVPASDVVVGNQTTPQDVMQPVTDLEPNTAYRARLVASRDFAAGSATSDEQLFTTPAAPPGITEVGAREVTDTTVLLAGRVDPNRLHTTYRFEYGTDTSYGSATPVDNAGSGARPEPVSKAVAGLQPNTTYHFRLVASNAAGETPGSDETFTTDSGPPPPSGRAYEMVSPLDKNGGDVDRDFLFSFNGVSQSGATPSGNAAAFTSRLQFGDPESGPQHPTYVARRGDAGWTTEGVNPPIGNVAAATEWPSVLGLSSDLSKAFVTSPLPLTSEVPKLNGSWGLFMRSSNAAERYTLLSIPHPIPPAEKLEPADTNETFSTIRFEYEAATPDSRHVVFNATRRLMEEAPEDGTGVPNAVYEWVDGTLRLVSVPPPGISFNDDNTHVAGGGLARLIDGQLHGDHVISDDGRRIFFSAPTQGAQQAQQALFVREHGTTTRLVSATEPPSDPPVVVDGNISRFWAAKATDGSVAIFSNNKPLTEHAGTGSVYRWDANAEEDEPRLTELSQLPNGPNDVPGALGPAAVTDDATTVYFVATGDLASGAEPGKPNLFMWRQGAGVRHIATLAGAPVVNGIDALVWGLRQQDGGRAARVSADGERLLFASFADLDDTYDTREVTPEACGSPTEAGEPCRQIYLYDARTDDVACLTCIPGVSVTGNANLFGNRQDGRPGEPPVSAPLQLPRNLSADGTRAFFETARPLVSSDQNNQLDVYEWEDADLDGEGELHLISPGRGTTDSKFLDASVSGDDVFFTTREQLVGIDTDNQVDLYDARVGGGIPAQNPPPPVSPCEGEDCQGGLSGAPFLPGVGSGGASHGDLRPGPRPAFSLARLSRAQLAQLARGRRVVVRVRVNQAGRVSLTARANLGRRMRAVARASKSARRAGRVGLGVKLSRSALRELGRDGRLNVRLAVRFAGVREPRTSMLRLRRASSSGERRSR